LREAQAIFGVTITDLRQYESAVAKLGDLSAKNESVPLVVRVVFSPIKEKDAVKFDAELRRYRERVADLRKKVKDKEGCGVYVMGTIADSFEMNFYLPDKRDPKWPKVYRNYEQWTERLVSEMGDLVDVWEVGNEVNGEWYGWEKGAYKGDKPEKARQRSDMRDRIRVELTAAFNKVRELRPTGLTAVTLLYNDDGERRCEEYSEYRMKDWATKYLPPALIAGTDYVFLSYYENTQDCPNVTQDPEKLVTVLASLRELFNGDQTAFGFGETSYKQTCYKKDDPEDEIEDSERAKDALCQAGQQSYVERYYLTLDRYLSAAVRGYRPQGGDKGIKFVGGYFYWYFLQDIAQPTDAPAWKILLDSRDAFRK
jgi:hypothetical protein